MSTNRFLTLINGIQNLVTAIASSTGVSDANKIIATSSNGKLDMSLMPVGIGVSTETIVASEALAAGDFVNIYNNAGTRNVRKADASNFRPANGFVLSAVTLGQNATAYLQGVNTALTGLTPGTIMFLSASIAGNATATAPSTTGHLVQPIGIAISTTGINFETDAYIILG